jgi:uncharacterized protein
MACPICDRTTDAHYRPFCSKRCADLDLAKWLTGSYAIPGEVAEDDDPDLPDTHGRGDPH